MTVSVHIVTWNSKVFLPTLLHSLTNQICPLQKILVVDNASEDGTIELLKEWPQVRLLRNTRNLGFAHANNQAISLSASEAVLIVNPDVILEPGCIKELVRVLASDPGLASVCPKLLRFSLSADDLRQPLYSDTIDSAGMIVKRSRQALNRGEGEADHGQYQITEQVFGAPGVLALYRRAALQDVARGNEVFDEDFFAYKEDVDLAWRLRLAGWTARYVPQAVAFHYRAVHHHGDQLTAVAMMRKQRSSLIRKLSYRNHILMLVKNETLGSFVPHLPFILWYELKKFFYLLVRETTTLASIHEILHLLPRMREKHREIIARRRIKNSVMIRSFSL